MQLNHYLNFKGQTEPAFLFYQSVFGGEFSQLTRFGDIPDPKFPLSELEKTLILHICLPINAYTNLMGSDHFTSAPHELVMGNGHYISINIDYDEIEARRLFNQLSIHGHIDQQLEKTFWGALYGAFTDQFGVKWMVNCKLEHHFFES